MPHTCTYRCYVPHPSNPEVWPRTRNNTDRKKLSFSIPRYPLTPRVASGEATIEAGETLASSLRLNIYVHTDLKCSRNSQHTHYSLQSVLSKTYTKSVGRILFFQISTENLVMVSKLMCTAFLSLHLGRQSRTSS